MSQKENGLVMIPGPRGVEPSRGRRPNGVYSLLQLLLSLLGYVTLTHALPADGSRSLRLFKREGEDEPKAPDDPSLYIYLGTAMGLVLLGGAFAGLTIALMGQDEIYLQVIATSGEGKEKRDAHRVLRLLKRGKHWVLVTLLVGNVITNETLPIVLDRSIGGGYAAAITSTVLVIIFGEIVPQSLCVRFGLTIGAWSSSFVLALMWIFAPITWPIAKLLDYLLGEDHGTTYKKAGLKTLVTLHKQIGTSPAERLNQDEVSIISGVLDLKEKAVGSIMTPMDDVFTLSAHATLDEKMMHVIMSEGYSRIPVHDPRNPTDFVGMLLVKMLITYDPEDAKHVCDFALATLPETRPETSCLDIINFFQEGKSHMVLVSDFPGETKGALGVVTLEDVIEELIGEEIIDESDVFVDVHKAIRRMQPAPTHQARVPKGEIVTDPNNLQTPVDGNLVDVGDPNSNDPRDSTSRKNSFATDPIRRFSAEYSRSPKPTTFMKRRRSSGAGSTDVRPVQLRQYTAEMKEQLNRLGPSNAAKQPRHTRVNTVKIKPGVGTISEQDAAERPVTPTQGLTTALSDGATVGPGISPIRSAKDGVQAVKASFGAAGRRGRSKSPGAMQTSEGHDQGHPRDSSIPRSSAVAQQQSDGRQGIDRSDSHSTLGSIKQSRASSHNRWGAGNSRQSSHGRRVGSGVTRSGSITEQFVESGGVKKLVLEMTSSSSGGEDAEEGTSQTPGRKDLLSAEHSSRPGSRGRGGYGSGDGDVSGHGGEGDRTASAAAKKKKKKKNGKREKKKRDESKRDDDGAGEQGDENTPLLSRDQND